MITTVATYVGIAVVAAGLIYLLTRADSRVEERRRGAAVMAGELRAAGLVQVPEFLIDYSVGDYDGMGAKIVNLTRLANSGSTVVKQELDQVFDRMLAAKLGSPEGRQKLQAALEASKTEAKPPVTL